MALQGSGTAEDPYLIITYEDLSEFGGASGSYGVMVNSIIEPEKTFPFSSNSVIKYLDLDGFTLNIKCRGGNYSMYDGFSSSLTISNGVVEISNYRAIHNFYKVSSISWASSGSQLLFDKVKVLINVDKPNSLYEFRVRFNSGHELDNAICIIKGHTNSFSSIRQMENQKTFNANEAYSITGAVNLSQVVDSDFPSWMNPSDWIIKNDNIYYKGFQTRVLKGVAKVGESPLAGRDIYLIPCDSPNDYEITQTNQQGEFEHITERLEKPVMVMAFDKAERILQAGFIAQAGKSYIPEQQNGYRYQCIAGGEILTLPNPLPTSGLLQSGTAVFSIEPLIPPVCYGPVTPQRITQQ